MSWSFTKIGKDRGKLKQAITKVMLEGEKFNPPQVSQTVLESILRAVDAYPESEKYGLQVKASGHITGRGDGSYSLEIISMNVPLSADEELCEDTVQAAAKRGFRGVVEGS